MGHSLYHLADICTIIMYVKGKANLQQALRELLRDSFTLRLPEFLDNRHMNVARLPTVHTGRLYPLGNTPGTHSVRV